MSDTEIIQGKVKTVFSTAEPDEVCIQYEDKVTAGNGEKEDYPEGKGAICCEISSIIFKKLDGSISTVESLNENCSNVMVPDIVAVDWSLLTFIFKLVSDIKG